MAHIFKKSYSEKSLSYSSLLVVVGGEPDTGTLRVLDFSDSVQDLRLEPVDVLLVWAPGIVVGGVAPSNAH